MDIDNEYGIVQGETLTVSVRKLTGDDDAWEVFEVTGEAVPAYHASKQ